jgi:hypothetical protein
MGNTLLPFHNKLKGTNGNISSGLSLTFCSCITVCVQKPYGRAFWRVRCFEWRGESYTRNMPHSKDKLFPLIAFQAPVLFIQQAQERQS